MHGGIGSVVGHGEIVDEWRALVQGGFAMAGVRSRAQVLKVKFLYVSGTRARQRLPLDDAVTLVTLPCVTDAATMRKISYWRYSAVNRKTLFAALACAMLVFSMLGCGMSNKLQSIQLNAALINGVAPTGQSGFYTLQGLGGTIQLQAIGNYSDGKTRDLSNVVTYAMVVDPLNNVDQFGNVLPAPPQTASISVTGLVTATDPAACSWINIAVPPATTPSWAYVGDYTVTVTYQGIKSQPMYIPVASSTGIASTTNPTGQCGPGSTT